MSTGPDRAIRGTMFLALLGLALCSPELSGQTTGPKSPPLITSSLSGHDLFEFYCATCHGPDGRGGGPVVPALSVPPPDLTTISTRNGGTFPTARVESFVTGNQDRLTPAHGSRGMPVWGPIFRALDPSDTTNTVRIANIVAHLESIQRSN